MKDHCPQCFTPWVGRIIHTKGSVKKNHMKCKNEHWWTKEYRRAPGERNFKFVQTSVGREPFLEIGAAVQSAGTQP